MSPMTLANNVTVIAPYSLTLFSPCSYLMHLISLIKKGVKKFYMCAFECLHGMYTMLGAARLDILKLELVSCEPSYEGWELSPGPLK